MKPKQRRTLQGERRGRTTCPRLKGLSQIGKERTKTRDRVLAATDPQAGPGLNERKGPWSDEGLAGKGAGREGGTSSHPKSWGNDLGKGGIQV